MAVDKFSTFITHVFIVTIGFLVLYSLLMSSSGDRSSPLVERLTPKDAWDKKTEADKQKINRVNVLAVKQKLSTVSKNANKIANKVQSVYAKQAK